MEVLGAVASAVTLLEVAVNSATFIRGICEIQDDFKELCEEVSYIEDIVREARKTVGSVSTHSQERINAIVAQLETISNELSSIEAACSKANGDNNKVRAKKRKWLIESNKIAKLLRRAQKAKDNLSQAVQWEQWTHHKQMTTQMKVLSESMAQFTKSQPQIIDFMAVISSQLRNGGLSARVEELPDDASTDGDTLPRYESEVNDPDAAHYANNPYIPDNKVYVDVVPDVENQIATVLGGSTGLAPTGALVASRFVCDEYCHCHCHTKPWQMSTPDWMGTFLGRWNFQYLSTTEQPNHAWDSRCRCSKEGAVWMDYHTPKWSWARNLFSRQTYSLRCSLRPVRVIPLSDSVWNKLEQPADILRADIERGTVLFPDDQSEEGVELIESILYWNNYDLLELLMKEWRNILPKQGLSLRAGHSINWMNSYGRTEDLTERDTSLLELLGTFVNDGLGAEYQVTAIHVAAASGEGVLEAIDDCGRDVINQLDNTGLAAMHHASRYGHIRALKHLINSGADVNVGSSDGWTPLMNAAINQKYEVAEILLDANARVNQRAYSSTTALHQAVYHGAVDIVQLLIDRGASGTIKDLWGRTVVHYLAFGDQATVGESARMVHGIKGVDLNAPDIHDWTPFMFSLRYNNLPLIKFYLEAGVDLRPIDIWSLNVLHVSARFCKDYVLRYLLESPVIRAKSLHIDTRLANNLNDTPWDAHVMCIHAEPWELGSYRRPDRSASAQFAKLFEFLRDTNFEHDIDVMQRTLKALADDDMPTVAANIESLSQQMEDCHNGELAEWYRAVGKSAAGGSKQVAVDALGDLIEELRKEIGTSAWDRYCCYAPPSAVEYESEAPSADERSADERSADERSVDERSVDEHNADERSVDERNVEERTADELNDAEGAASDINNGGQDSQGLAELDSSLGGASPIELMREDSGASSVPDIRLNGLPIPSRVEKELDLR